MPEYIAVLEPIDPAQNVTLEMFVVQAADGTVIGNLPLAPTVNEILFAIDDPAVAVGAVCCVVDANAGGQAPPSPVFPIPAPPVPPAPTASRNIQSIQQVESLGPTAVGIRKLR